MRRFALLGLLGLAALTPAAPRDASACAPAPMAGQVVNIADEAALIVWDASQHIEHFIRRATFRTSAKDFGFLVPTPTRPTLAEASDAVFASLDNAIRPEVRVETTRGLEPTLACGFFLMRSSASRDDMQAAGVAPVRVLDEVRVAGYDATVLEADDAAALARWLADHRYATTPTLTAWLTPYVAMHWKITAFRVASPDPNDPRPPGTSPVRLSFNTDTPFYPYREPEDQRLPTTAPRSLRVHMVAPQRMDARLGERGVWPGAIAYASARDDMASLLSSLQGVTVSAGWWLTSWDDRSSPRPGTDEVFFSPAASQARWLPPPVVVYRSDRVPVPLDLLGLAGVVGALVWRRARRRRAQG